MSSTDGVGAPRRAPTLYDVARIAGVSHQTVSQVVKDGPNVKAETRQRVEAAIAQLNYTPNLAARALASPKSKRIGALFFDRYDEVGPTRTIQAAVDQAREAGYVVDVVGLDTRLPSGVDSAIELVLQAGVAGIIVLAPTTELVAEVRAREFAAPTVIVSDVVVHRRGRSTSRHEGLGVGVEYLAGLGHRRVAFVSGPMTWIPARDRAAEFRAGVEAHGLVSVAEREGDWSSRSGFDAGMAIPVDEGITAIVVSNDQMALGVLKAMATRGVSVPGDVSVIGFDDIPESGYFEPALTTIANDFEGMGRLAMDQLLCAIDPDRQPIATPPREATLVIRDSVGKAPSVQ